MPKDSTWDPPPSGWVKCNFDSSYKGETEEIGARWIIRDCTGHHITSGNARLSPVATVLQAEAKGFLHVIQTLWIKG